MSPPEAAGTIWSQGGGTAPGPGVSPLPHQAQTECSRGECTPCWQADGDPKTQGGFWLHLVEALALGEKEKIGKVPCIPSVPGSCLLLTASPPCWPWDDKGGEDQKGEGSCGSYPMHPLCYFFMFHEKQTAANFVNWRTHMSSESTTQVFPTAICSDSMKFCYNLFLLIFIYLCTTINSSCKRLKQLGCSTSQLLTGKTWILWVTSVYRQVFLIMDNAKKA